MLDQNIGILYFSLSTEKEAKRKAWTKNRKVNSQLALQLQKHNLALIKSTKIPFIVADESIQKGFSFGHKLAHCIEASFDQAYDHIIVIGNDCPHLTIDDIFRTRDLISKGKQNIGLTPKGGAYIFSISKHNWNKESFENLSWCTPNLGAQLAQHLTIDLDLNPLPLKGDLNFFDDFSVLLSQFKNAIISSLVSILHFELRVSYSSIPPIEHCLTGLHLRGPPTALSFPS